MHQRWQKNDLPHYSGCRILIMGCLWNYFSRNDVGLYPLVLLSLIFCLWTSFFFKLQRLVRTHTFCVNFDNERKTFRITFLFGNHPQKLIIGSVSYRAFFQKGTLFQISDDPERIKNVSPKIICQCPLDCGYCVGPHNIRTHNWACYFMFPMILSEIKVAQRSYASAL